MNEAINTKLDKLLNNESARYDARCMFFSENQLRRALTAGARREIYKVLGGKQEVVGRFVCNVESDLRAHGQGTLANQMIDAVIFNLLP